MVETKEENLETKVKAEKVDFDEIANAISDPTIEEKSGKLAEGFNVFYNSLQKAYHKDKSKDDKKEMGLENVNEFVADVKPLQEEGKINEVVDTIALQYAKNLDNPIIKDIAKKLEKALEEKDKSKEEVAQIRTALYHLVDSNLNELKLAQIKQAIMTQGLSKQLGEGLAKEMAGAYQNDKVSPYTSKITDFQREPLAEYVAKNYKGLDTTKLKALQTQQLFQVFSGLKQTEKKYQLSKQHVEGMKLKPEERQAKFKELEKSYVTNMKQLTQLYMASDKAKNN